MLLPSVLPCDSAHSAPLTRCQSSRFASPPLSPPSSSSAPLGTCRALQYLLMPSTPLPNTQQLPPSPPTTQMASPFKLRLRTRKSADSDAATFTPRKKITKRAAPARGASKRRRDVDDDMTRDEVYSENDEVSSHEDTAAPSTPKRLRFAPPVLPLGLERSDFHNLDLDLDKDNQIESVEDGDGQEVWSTEDDRMLVELVLEKLRLSKSALQDCARSLGKDKESVGRRWKSLMGNGEVGLKRQRRTKLHGTWR